jgi:glycine dehydrogenase subunit 2
MEKLKDIKFEGRGLEYEIPLIFETSSKDKNLSGVDLEDFPDFDIATGQEEREDLNLPIHSEPQVIRHFTRLSQQNYSIDTGFYPLGSCTMKYNPKINEKVARFPGFADIHPLQAEDTVQGALEVIYELQHWLCEMSGLDAASTNPAAGAHGEYTGIKIIKEAHLAKEGTQRKYIIIPDSAHGTNPATAAMCGYEILTIKTYDDGCCHLESISELISKYGKEIAGIMLTNPNTCGKFEKEVNKIADLIHSIGAYFYCDGANFNAIVGNIKPAAFGVDVMHFNLHKTFSTPHGGGGPGCGPIAVCPELKPYLPVPYVKKEDGVFSIVKDREASIGQIKGFYGQFTLMVRALSYMVSNGKEGLAQVGRDAVLSANYVLAKLRDFYHVPYEGFCMHECLFTDKFQKIDGISTLDIAKALVEFGFHPMTMYFPLTVSGAMLIEPTETESKETIDKFIETMIHIAKMVKAGKQDEIKSFPISTPRRRLDETGAARQPKLRY